MGWEPAAKASGTHWQARFLAEILDDPYAAVRYVAYRSLRKQSGFERFSYDFLSSSPRRSEAVQRAVDNWSRSNKFQGHFESRSELLFKADGSVDSDAVKVLSRDRDDRIVDLLE
jgi:predicted Zn-dependent protease